MAPKPRLAEDVPKRNACRTWGGWNRLLLPLARSTDLYWALSILGAALTEAGATRRKQEALSARFQFGLQRRQEIVRTAETGPRTLLVEGLLTITMT